MTREALQELARPRLFGTAGATYVRDRIRARLEALGFHVEAQPFQFSTWPGRYAVPALGVFLTLAFGLAAALLFRGEAGPAAAVVAVALVLLLPLPFLAGPAIASLPFARAEGTNLLARRPGGEVRILVIAHRDSKSQAVPLAVRIAAAAVLLVTAPATVGAAATGASAFAIPFALAGATAAAVLTLCGTGNTSPGALDNASGLVALLELASMPDLPDVAFLVTDAEELGLAGARAAAREWTGLEAVFNLDGLDDAGPLRLLTGRGPAARRRAQPLVVALAGSAMAQGLEVREHGVPAGLMVDHLPFAGCTAALTVMRGHTRALARVHRAADHPARMSGAGAVEVARIVRAAIRSLAAPRA